jgi:tetratricopeptide (TPR) repeat protein
MLIFNEFLLTFIIAWHGFYIESPTFILAEKFFISKQYYDAITEYKRCIFFDEIKNIEKVGFCYYKIGLAYRNQEKWEESIEALSQSIQSGISENIVDERKIELAIVLICKGNFNEARFLLLKTEMFASSPELKMKAAFFRAIASVYINDWQEVEAALKVYSLSLDQKSSAKLRELESILATYHKTKFKSPQKAKMFSTILPGSGQIYSKDLQNGLKAMVINLALVYLLVKNILVNDYQDAIFNYLFYFERFYNGNRMNAELAAQKTNKRINEKFAAKILQWLLAE